MAFSKRLKGLLGWWVLHIQKTHEETKEKNVKGNDTIADSTVSVHMGNTDNERPIEEKE